MISSDCINTNKVVIYFVVLLFPWLHTNTMVLGGLRNEELKAHTYLLTRNFLEDFYFFTRMSSKTVKEGVGSHYHSKIQTIALIVGDKRFPSPSLP